MSSALSSNQIHIFEPQRILEQINYQDTVSNGLVDNANVVIVFEPRRFKSMY